MQMQNDVCVCVCVKGTPALSVSFCTFLSFSQQTLTLDFQPGSRTSACEEQTLVPRALDLSGGGGPMSYKSVCACIYLHVCLWCADKEEVVKHV